MVREICHSLAGQKVPPGPDLLDAERNFLRNESHVVHPGKIARIERALTVLRQSLSAPPKESLGVGEGEADFGEEDDVESEDPVGYRMGWSKIDRRVRFRRP